MNSNNQEKKRMVILSGFLVIFIYGLSVGLIAGSIYLLSQYETKWLYTLRALQNISHHIISLQPNSSIDTAHNGKIIYVTGIIATPDIVTDPFFSISANTAKIQRSVEMYQWMSNSNGPRNNRGGTSSRATYPGWANTPQNRGVRNPPMQLLPEAFFAKNVSVGNFMLAPEFISQIPATTPINPDKLNLTKLEKIKTPIHVIDNGLYAGVSPQQPSLGDYKISLYQAFQVRLSIIGIQHNQVLEPYKITAENTLALLQPGTVSPLRMIEEAKYTSLFWLWLVRIVSLLMMITGVIFWVRPFIIYTKICPLEIFLNFGERRSAVIVGLILWGMFLFLNWMTIQPAWAVALGVSIILIVSLLIRGGIKQIATKKEFIDRA